MVALSNAELDLVQSSRVQLRTSSEILREHGDRPLGTSESARIWTNAALPGTELFRGSYRTHEFARHFHTVAAIGVVDSGAMRSYCRRANHEVPAGTVLLFNPGEVHAPGPANVHGWSFRVFFFEDTAFAALSSEISGGIQSFSTPFAYDPFLAQSLVHLHRSLEAGEDTLAADSILLDIFERLARQHIPRTKDFPSLPVTVLAVQRAREYLDASYAREVTLAELAEVAGRSRYHLLRSFRDALGLTPHAYLIQVRVEAAKRLLKSGISICTVAARTGFTDQSHLTRHFKRLTGITPNRYAQHLSSPLFSSRTTRS